jgi:putative ABC transport system substrate-binding protein
MPDMKRREFIALLGGGGLLLAAKVKRARGQQAAMPVVGFLRSASLTDATQLIDAFRQGLKEIGYVEGQNVAIEFRSANNDHDHLTALATDFARRPVAVIVGTAASKADTPDEVTNELSVSQSPLNSRRFSNLISLLFRLHRCRQVR